MKKIMILFAHPAYHKSYINRQLMEGIRNLEGITVNDLYENYPDFYIDVANEQQLLLDHDVIVWQHPFYWYSAPAILKEWMDLVLQHGFAYGRSGRALEGKWVMSTISTGGRKEMYSKTGANHYSINEFLVPFRQSANLCRMEYLPPYVVHGSHLMTEELLRKHIAEYRQLLTMIRDEKVTLTEIRKMEYMNELILQNV